MLFLKTFKGVKFVVDGNAFQTFITVSTKNFCLMLAVLHACVLVVVYTCFHFYCTLCTVRLNNNNNIIIIIIIGSTWSVMVREWSCTWLVLRRETKATTNVIGSLADQAESTGSSRSSSSVSNVRRYCFYTCFNCMLLARACQGLFTHVYVARCCAR